MIIGTGIDLVDIQRMESWLGLPDLLERYFTANEIEYIHSKKTGSAASLAARFAAREAFGKALGRGLIGMKLKDLEVCVGKQGRPYFCFGPSALKALKEIGECSVHLSIAHERGMAIAQVIIEEKNCG